MQVEAVVIYVSVRARRARVVRFLRLGEYHYGITVKQLTVLRACGIEGGGEGKGGSEEEGDRDSERASARDA